MICPLLPFNIQSFYKYARRQLKMSNAQAFIYKAETFIYKLPTNQAEDENFMHELSEQLLSLFSEPNGAQPAVPKAEVLQF